MQQKNGKAFEEGEQISAGRGTRSDLTELLKTTNPTTKYFKIQKTYLL